MSRDQIFLSLNIPLIVETAVRSDSRDRLVVRTLCCGRFESWSFDTLYNKSNLFLSLFIFYPFVCSYYNFLILTV